jgi:hypothetical protein
MGKEKPNVFSTGPRNNYNVIRKLFFRTKWQVVHTYPTGSTFTSVYLVSILFKKSTQGFLGSLDPVIFK